MRKLKLHTPTIINSIGALLFVLIISIAAFSFLRKGAYVYVTLKVTNSDQVVNNWNFSTPQWYIEHLKEGLQEKDVFGRVNVEVVDVHYYTALDDTENVFITLRLRTTYNNKTNQYSHNGLPLLQGDHFITKVNNIAIFGLISNLSSELITPKHKTFRVTGTLETQYNEETLPANFYFHGIKKSVSDQLVPNLEVKDNKARTVAKIISIKKTPGLMTLPTASSVQQVVDPEREMVRMTVDIDTIEVNGVYLFREELPIYIDQKLRLDFPNTFVNLTVEEITPID